MKLRRHQCISSLNAQLVGHDGLRLASNGTCKGSIPNADLAACNLSAAILHGDIHDSGLVHLEKKCNAFVVDNKVPSVSSWKVLFLAEVKLCLNLNQLPVSLHK
jgi:hypothetical protein